MKITVKGKEVSDFKTWKEAFCQIDSDVHWEEGRSACSLARHFTQPSIDKSEGIEMLTKFLYSLGFDDVKLTRGEVEHESSFDNYKKGRMQDLVLWGECGNEPVVICVEAKVDEPFGDTIEQAYMDAESYLQKSPESKKKVRIIDLCARYFDNAAPEQCFQYRYQLLHYLAGSLNEAAKEKAALFMPVIVYKTSKYNEKAGERNLEDYLNFMQSQKFTRYDTDGIIVFKNRMEGVDVFSAYIEVE